MKYVLHMAALPACEPNPDSKMILTYMHADCGTGE